MRLAVALAVALVAIALFGCGTPRQAGDLFRNRLRKQGRIAVRITGMTLLVASLVIALAGGDAGRALIAWTLVTGLEAFVVALLFTARAKPSRRS